MTVREMVKVILYDDGTYEVKDVESCYTTQHLYGTIGGQSCEIYYCLKHRWKEYLLKLLSTKEIDKEITTLQKRKKKIEKLKDKISKEIEKKTI